VPFGWRTRISSWAPPSRFVDEQLRGPYRRWVHTHLFESSGEGTLMTDRVEYRLAGHALAAPVLPLVRRQLDRIFRHRARTIREILLPSGAS
jgi:ligand-binding SRPBCC domain-containing protein